MIQDDMCCDRTTEPRQSARRPCAVVLAMHRSGSSALAGFLSSLGAAEPLDVMAGDANNEKGYFESTAVAALNDEILTALGTDWSGVAAVDTERLSPSLVAEFTTRATALIEAQFPDTGGAEAVVLKDPRICRFPQFWDRAVRGAGMVPFYVFSHRNPMEVAASLSRRNGFLTEYALLLWLRHTLDAEQGSRGFSRVHVSYEMLLQDPTGVAARVAGPLALRAAGAEATRDGTALGFLDAGLRHHVAPAEGGADFVTWVAEVFEILARWARHGEEAADYTTLDRVRAALDASLRLWGGLVAEGEPQRLRYRTGLAQVEAALAVTDVAAPLPTGPLIDAFDVLLARSVEAFQARHIALTAQLRLAERATQAANGLLRSERAWVQGISARLTDAILPEADHDLNAPPNTFAALEAMFAKIEILHQSQQENHDLRARLAARETEIGQIVNSRAWRVTGPLRGLVQMLRLRRARLATDTV